MTSHLRWKIQQSNRFSTETLEATRALNDGRKQLPTYITLLGKAIFHMWTLLKVMLSSSIYLLVNDKNFILLCDWFPDSKISFFVVDFLIHKSVMGHLGCFHSLSIIKSAGINMGVLVLLYTLSHIPLGISLRVGLLDHMAYLCLVF
jgi:hypothetical protein